MSAKIKIVLFLSLGFFLTTQLYAQDKNISIGELAGSAIVFTADTLVLKNKFTQLVRNSLSTTDRQNAGNISIDKISIEKGSIRDTNVEFYFLLVRDNKLKLKAATILHKSGKELILFYNNAELSHDEQNLRMIYMVCYGSDDNCFPTLAVTEKGKIYWTSSPVMQYY